MQYKCETCYDTGSRDQIGTYLDCNECGVAQTRRDLNDFVKSLGPTHPEDVALAIHQRALAMAPKQAAQTESLPEMTDDLIFQWAEGYVFTIKGMPHKMTFSRPRFVAAVRTIIAHLPTPIAAPATANGALTDERAAFDQWSKPIPYVLFSDYAWQAWQARAILAAAGPDAALIDLIQKHWNGAYFQGVTKAEAREINEILALSGAKGN